MEKKMLTASDFVVGQLFEMYYNVSCTKKTTYRVVGVTEKYLMFAPLGGAVDRAGYEYVSRKMVR
jgi:hypothetical protein